MDKLHRDTMFAGFSDHDIGEAIVMEMRRRGLFGCLFMFPAGEGTGTFVSSSPANTVADFSAAEQLRLFADVAELAVSESPTKMNGEVDTAVDSKWVN